jgi:hypothetical protein
MRESSSIVGKPYLGFLPVCSSTVQNWTLPPRSTGLVLCFENDLLRTPVQELGDVQLIRGRASNLVNPSESLSGRADVVELETLSLREIRAALPQTVVESTMVEVDSRNCMPT